MRFVRVFIDRATGEPVEVHESELPIGAWLRDQDGEFPFYDLGLMADFNAKTVDGAKCSPAQAIRERIEKHPHADSHPDAPKLRFKADSRLPKAVFCPCGVEDIKSHLRANGHERMPSIALAWLARVLPPDSISAIGAKSRVSLAMLKSMEGNRRNLIDGGQKAHFERHIQRQSDARSAIALERRKRIQAEAATSGWAEMQAFAESRPAEKQE